MSELPGDRISLAPAVPGFPSLDSIWSDYRSWLFFGPIRVLGNGLGRVKGSRLSFLGERRPPHVAGVSLPGSGEEGCALVPLAYAWCPSLAPLLTLPYEAHDGLGCAGSRWQGGLRRVPPPGPQGKYI